MKYTARIANFGVEDLDGEILTPNVMIKRELPVTWNFNGPVIGFAKALKDKTGIVAEIEIYDDGPFKRLASLMTGVIGGSILKRNGKKITKYRVDSVGLTLHPADPTLPKLQKLGEQE
jgi:hypothetical protein